ncbi:hypothetical protein MTR_7g083070 [Medicago truncatula]|uniref:Uncharacterized protein n=1 Tax=Medicago truncatula TaxID=3880 RepID=G7KW43_MEDTR|nr:hypothetical protein MTR_7g083070 [Medicago truncatula]
MESEPLQDLLGLQNRKFLRLKWTDICKTEEEGGLGVNDLRLFNVARLVKWRLLNGETSAWKELLKVKCGERELILLNFNLTRPIKFASLWWKDICNVGKERGTNQDLVFEFVKKKI